MNLLDGSWEPIPGYDNRYFISQRGVVCNLDGHMLKATPSKAGPQVELRKDGQRDRVLILDLLRSVGYTVSGEGSE